MRSPLPDYELVAQLSAFMRLVPQLWSWSDLAALRSSGNSITEHLGPIDAPLTFDIEILEHDRNQTGEYLHVMVGLSDSVRSKELPASSWGPLTTSFLWYWSGELDVPSSEELARKLAAR